MGGWLKIDLEVVVNTCCQNRPPPRRIKVLTSFGYLDQYTQAKGQYPDNLCRLYIYIYISLSLSLSLPIYQLQMGQRLVYPHPLKKKILGEGGNEFWRSPCAHGFLRAVFFFFFFERDTSLLTRRSLSGGAFGSVCLEG